MQLNLSKFQSLLWCLLLTIGTLHAQTPKIDGVAGVKQAMVPAGYAKKFVASGCAVTDFYVWEYRNITTGGSFALVPNWNNFYGVGSGSVADGNKVEVQTVDLGDPGERSEREYRVSCSSVQGTLVPANTKASIVLNVRPTNFVPQARTVSPTCGNITGNFTGSLGIVTNGECLEGFRWEYPDGSTFDEDADVGLSGNYPVGNYRVACIFPNVADTGTDGRQEGTSSIHTFTGAKASVEVKRYYNPPVISTSNLLMQFANVEYQDKIVNGNSKVDICSDNQLYVTSLNLANTRNSLGTYYDFQFVYRNQETWGRFLPVPNVVNTNVNQVLATISGVYGLKITDKQILNGRPACLAEGSVIVDNAAINFTPGLEVNIQNLAKPTITSVTNFNVCPNGTTPLVADGATNPKTFNWTYNNALVTDNSTNTLTIGATGTAQVYYTSNLSNSLGVNCVSPVSEITTIAAFTAPEKPSITSSGKSSYCEYLSISDRLTAVSNQAVAWAWSTGGTTKEVTANAFGSYTVQITDANGCTASSDPFSITKIARPAAPSVAMAAGSLDLNCVLGANGSPTAVGLVVSNPEDAKFSYQWFTTNSETALGSGSALNGVTGNATGSVTYYAIRTDKTTNCFSDREASKVTGKRLIFQANPVDNAAKVSKEAYAMKVNFASSLGGATAGAHEWKYGNTTLPETGEKANAFNANGGNGDYTVRRNYTYSIEGRSLVCWSNSVKYTYVADPDFAGVIVYPNPTNAEVKVSVLDQATWANANVLIYDMAGRLLYSGTLSGSAIQTNNLGNGVYVLNIRSNNGEKTFQTKLVVNK